MSGGCLCSKHIEKILLQSWSCDLDHVIIVASLLSTIIWFTMSSQLLLLLLSLYHFWHYTWQFCSLSIFYLTDWLSYRVFVYWARYAGNCICLGETIPVPCKLCVQKLFMINFPSSFLFSSIKILLTNNILISFDHPLCNLKHIAFLIIPLHNIFKSFPLTVILIMIPEQSTNTSQFLVMLFKWFSRTKMSQN